MTKPFCDKVHEFVSSGTTRIHECGLNEWDYCDMPTAAESYRTTEPCGHTSNFQIGDEMGNFTCTVCRIDELEIALRGCAMIARREFAKLSGTGPPRDIPGQITQWTHILRLCEKAGVKSSCLRDSE